MNFGKNRSINYIQRRLTSMFFFSVTTLCALFTIGVLFFILGYILYQGFSSLNVDFFMQLPRPVGEEGGGMAHAIIGTGKLILLAIMIGAPIGLLGGIYLSEYGQKGLSGFLVRYAADLLNGIPSIVIGIFVYTVLVLWMGHFSTLAGGCALGIMVIPTVLRGTEEFLKVVPASLREGGLALGLSESKTICRIVLPAALSGILTCVMLALARVAGETAPLLFTAFGNRYFSEGWLEPTASLPVMIYTYAISPYPDWQRQAWAGGAVLLILVLLANVASRMILRGRKP